MNAKTEERLKEIMPLLPTQAPEGIVEEAERRCHIQGEALVFRMEWQPGKNGKKEKKVRLTCSCCKEDSICEYVSLGREDTNRTCGYAYGWQGTYGFKLDNGETLKHNSACVCPICGYGGTVYLASKINHATRIDSVNMLSVHNFGGALGLLGWYIGKYIGKDGKTFTTVSGTDGVLVLEKTMVRVRKYAFFFSTRQLLHLWEYKKTFNYDISTVPTDVYYGLDRKLLEQTTADRSGLVDYVMHGGKHPVKFLRTWQKYPQLENLAVQGYSKLVDCVLEQSYYSVFDMGKSFNMKFKSPDKMLGISKCERWVARGYRLPELEYYRRMRDEYGILLDKELMDTVNKVGPSMLNGLTAERKYGKVLPIHLLRYLTRQKGDAFHLRDYWDMCIKLYERIPSEIKWPANLTKAHDEVTKQIAWQTEQKLISGFAEAKEKFAPYAWRDEELGLCIRICYNQKEMIAEGEALHHCVARYAESHSRGETCIMFIRHIASPDVPYFTLELKNGKVVQNRGKHNCERTPEVREFEKKWLEHIEKLEKKGKLNEKRSSRNQERIRAGA